MSKTKIVFSKELSIDPNEFVTLWNNTPECRDIAEARLSQLAKTQFADPSLLAGAIEFTAGAIAGGILHDSVKGGIKICIAKIKETVIAIKYKDIKQSDGGMITKVLTEKDNTPPSE
jgi:hypothetical protein